MSWIDQFVGRCHLTLPDEVRESLWGRGASDEQIDLFRVGYINGELPSDIEYPNAFLEWSLDGSKLSDFYVFPLTDWLGDVKGVQFRPVPRDKKGYTDFFIDKTQAVLFGLGPAASSVWGTGKVCLVEGVFDLFPVQRVVPHVIATLTAKVSDALVRSLLRIAKQVHLLYDNDATGERGRDKFIRFYGSLFDTRVVEYPRGVVMSNGSRVKDPGDLWEAWGDDRVGPYLRSQLE